MKTIKVKEFKDLSIKQKEETTSKATGECIEFKLSLLENMSVNEGMTDKDFYKELGCSKSYAESTGWFIPSCYYDKHKAEIDKEVIKWLNKQIFTTHGEVIII